MCFYNRHRHLLEISAHCRQQTVRASVLPTYSDTPEMFSFTLAGHAVGNSPRPSACPNTDMELVMGASALGIAEDQRGPRLKRLNSYKGFLKSFHRRNFSSHSGAWLVRLSRQTLLDSRAGRRGLGFSALRLVGPRFFGLESQPWPFPRDGVCDAWLTCALCIFAIESVYHLIPR